MFVIRCLRYDVRVVHARVPAQQLTNKRVVRVRDVFVSRINEPKRRHRPRARVFHGDVYTL